MSELREKNGAIIEDTLGARRKTLVRYYLEILETPIGDIDSSHRLAQELKISTEGTSIKMPSKLDARVRYPGTRQRAF